MMNGMASGFIYVSISTVILLTGFAYLILVAANKESSWLKMAGQIIAVLVAVIALSVLLYSGTWIGRKGASCGMMGQDMNKMGGMKGMMMDKAMMQKHIEEMMQMPGMKQQIQEYLKTHK